MIGANQEAVILITMFAGVGIAIMWIIKMAAEDYRNWRRQRDGDD